MHDICEDLAAEKADLVAVLRSLAREAWSRPTPAEGWDVGDQVAHLAFFDEKAVLAHEDPDAFLAELPRVAEILDTHLDAGRAMTPQELLLWWNDANSRLVATYRPLDSRDRVVWYGPPMAARSKVTARIMETWAHGQDIADALGISRDPTPRLRHVCHIGVRARAFSYAANNRTVPEEDVFVDLRSPTGEHWQWGNADAEHRVTGSALGFALLVTQRRHRADVDVGASGLLADEWLGIAQAFAGPPGAGRRPGQFAHLASL